MELKKPYVSITITEETLLKIRNTHIGYIRTILRETYMMKNIAKAFRHESDI